MLAGYRALADLLDLVSVFEAMVDTVTYSSYSIMLP